MKRQRRRRRFIYVTCSKAEKREWQQLANEEGLSLAAWLRSLLACCADDAGITRKRMCANEKLFFKPYEKQMRKK